MVDVSHKPAAQREAEARGALHLRPETLELIRKNAVAKGDVLSVARVAAILAAKRTPELIPLCHSLPISHVEVDFHLDEASSRLLISARVRTRAPTGVEMEALTAVAVAGLTIYDMCKAVDRGMVLTDVRLTFKTGGKSGNFRAD
jgi:cyclic pyranopterin phosphate synthase